MKLYIKQKVFSWRDKFNVKDEFGCDRYSVYGEIISLGKKLHICDENGVEVAFIRQKVMSFHHRYYIEMNGHVVCELVKDITFFKQKYRLVGSSWQMDGDFLAHEYSLNDGAMPIMRLSKKWLTWGDSYELDILDPQNELLCLCIALAVDCVLAQSRS